VQADVAAVQANVAAVQVNVAAVQVNVAAVQADVAAVQANVAAVQANVAAVQANVAAVHAEIKETAEQLRSEFQHGFDDLKETMRDGQTELLRAFYSFAQSTDAKLKDSEVGDFMLRQRLTAVEFRLTEIERRIHLPPEQTQ
jgi:peptidoglycan hydrolase CwlO-like protein